MKGAGEERVMMMMMMMAAGKEKKMLVLLHALCQSKGGVNIFPFHAGGAC